MENTPLSRRDFVKTASLAATVLGSGLSARAQPAEAPRAPGDFSRLGRPLVGFQAEVAYVVKYGVARFLDDVQERASVNALFLHGDPFAASWDGLDRTREALGEFGAAHPEYYKDVGMPARAFGAGDFDFAGAMDRISAECRRRGVKVFAWMEDDNRPQPKIRGMDRLYEIDLHGRRTSGHPGGPCLNNPSYRRLVAAQIEDYLKSFRVDGLQRGSERQGPLSNALGAWHHGAKSDPGKTSCFCEYCLAKGKEQGIDTDRVRAGFLALEPYVRNGREKKRPRDGYHVEFWRLLLRHPELLAWQTFWADSMRETQREFHARAKAIRADVPVGFHIWQNASFHPIYRAEQDYQPYLEYADFLKPVVYDNPAAERMASYAYSVSQNMLGDLTPAQALEFDYRVMDLQEQPYDRIIGGGRSRYEAQLGQLAVNETPAPARAFERFSSDYVLRETKRAAEALAGSGTKLWPGLGIDVQVKNSTPESVREAVHAIFQGGGTGLIICTSHAAMRPDNLSAAGAALRELKLA
ncbi:MAG TPA: twin-arginine translocation signal domain-containing protein [Opitutaceae bacterium]|nr:twin-arginine translocation signal domain-containing protein [Opitutaceae bacterium]